MRGEMVPGEALPNEADGSARLKVSRTALREAIKVLAAKGLIESRPKTGTRVRPREDWNFLDPDVLAWRLAAAPIDRYVKDLFELHRVIEPAAASLAALRATATEIERIEDAYCGTGNSARSIMAEVILVRWGQGRFRSFSAGSHPRGRIHPLTVEILHRMHHSTEGLRSKDWIEFARPDSPPLDFVFTVCDQTAGEVCPAWPGQPMTAHWGVEDPAAFEGPIEKQRQIFKRVYLELDARIKIFSSLRIEKLDRLTLQKNLDEIGRVQLADGEFRKIA